MTTSKLKAILTLTLVVLLGAGLLWVEASGESPAVQGIGRADMPMAVVATLPRGAMARLEGPRLRHNGSITSIAFSADSKQIISEGRNTTGYRKETWDVATGKRLGACALEHQSKVAVISGDGKLLASVSEKAVHVSNAETGQEIRRWNAPASCGALAFSPDGKTLAFADDLRQGPIKLWEVSTGKEIGTVGNQGPLVGCLAFAPDGKTLASAAEYVPEVGTAIQLWEVATGKKVHTLRWDLPQRARPVFSSKLAFAPDGKTLASADDDDKGTIRLWDTAAGKVIRTLNGHDSQARSLAFAPDGGALISSSSGDIRLWDVASGKQIHRWPVHDNEGIAVAFAPDGKTLAWSAGSTIRLWNAATTQELHAAPGHRSSVFAVHFAANGKTVGSSSSDAVVLWEMATGKQAHTITVRDHCLGITPDVKRFVAMPAHRSSQKNIELRGIANDNKTEPVVVNAGYNPTVQFSPDGKTLVTVVQGGELRLWEVATGKEIRKCKGSMLNVHALTFSPDGGFLATSEGDYKNGVVRLWDTATGRNVRALDKFKCKIDITFLAFAPDGNLVAFRDSANGDALGVWEVSSGLRMRTLDVAKFAGPIAFAPDGGIIASGGHDGVIRLWETTRGKEIRALMSNEAAVSSLAFSPDGKTLVSGHSNGASLAWEVKGSHPVEDPVR